MPYEINLALGGEHFAKVTLPEDTDEAARAKFLRIARMFRNECGAIANATLTRWDSRGEVIAASGQYEPSSPTKAALYKTGRLNRAGMLQAGGQHTDGLVKVEYELHVRHDVLGSVPLYKVFHKDTYVCSLQETSFESLTL